MTRRIGHPQAGRWSSPTLAAGETAWEWRPREVEPGAAAGRARARGGVSKSWGALPRLRRTCASCWRGAAARGCRGAPSILQSPSGSSRSRSWLQEPGCAGRQPPLLAWTCGRPAASVRHVHVGAAWSGASRGRAAWQRPLLPMSQTPRRVRLCLAWHRPHPGRRSRAGLHLRASARAAGET